MASSKSTHRRQHYTPAQREAERIAKSKWAKANRGRINARKRYRYATDPVFRAHTLTEGRAARSVMVNRWPKSIANKTNQNTKRKIRLRTDPTYRAKINTSDRERYRKWRATHPPRKLTVQKRLRQNAKLRKRYATDPIYRAYMLKYGTEWREANPDYNRQHYSKHQEHLKTKQRERTATRDPVRKKMRIAYSRAYDNSPLRYAVTRAIRRTPEFKKALKRYHVAYIKTKRKAA